MYIHEAKITFTGAFPLDMLRYDACYPVTQADVGMLTTRPAQSQNVFVAQRSDSKTHSFTPERWKSFGCTCTPTRTVKV